MDKASLVTMLDHLEERAKDILYNEDMYGYYRGFLQVYDSFIEQVYGLGHYYALESESSPSSDRVLESMLEILRAVRKEIESGFLFFNLKELISGELISDYFDMAEHLLEENYEDPAAVIIGSSLENYLRHLCELNSLPTDFDNDKGRKSAGRLNEDLYKFGVYGKLDLKQVGLWLDIRNNAAHGNYNEYNSSDVSQMLVGVRNFMTKFKQFPRS